MFTPEEIAERCEGLEKAVFGGYSVSSVEELLTPLQEDYSALYEENEALKEKLKLLAEKLTEYRDQEDSIKRTLIKAQTTADEMVAAAERRSAKMLVDSEERLRQRSQELSREVLAEQERVNRAKEDAARFIVEIEERIQAHLVLLERIKSMDLTAGAPVPSAPEPASQEEDGKQDAPQEEDDGISRMISQIASVQDSMGDTRVIRPMD